MRKELDDKLCRECPNLYRDRHASIIVSCMPWGFETMPGWNDIIYDMSIKLEALIMALPENERQYYRATQIKEKYGTLRAYMSAETDEMQVVIDEAEEKSAVTCEYCGQPGILRTKGWHFTLCDECNKERPWRHKTESE